MRATRSVCLSVFAGVLLGGSAMTHAASGVKLTWSPPSTREDGEPLKAADLAGYELYYTTDDPAVSGTVEIDGGSTSTYTLQDLAAGNYHFAMSAIDTSGAKSKLSSIADFTVAASTAAPSVPGGMVLNSSGSGDLTVSWQVPTTRVDGTPLAAAELSGYQIVVYSYQLVGLFNYGSVKAIPVTVNGGSVNRYVVANVDSGPCSVVMYAIDTNGKASAIRYQFTTIK